MKAASELLQINGREVSISNPQKVLFPGPGFTKLHLVHYYLAVAEGALRGAGGRPNVLVRYPNGIEGDFFFQKRAPDSRPDWIEVVELSFPSGRTAEEVVPRDAAALAWMANLACLELHPHPVLAEDLDHPNELRVDLDPIPGVTWQQVRNVAAVVEETLKDFGLVGWPKTSGSRGIHVNVRIEARWTFGEVRRAALALAREVERRAPNLATSKWWKEERHGVFIDYNQNAKDRTVAAAYSVRPKPDARVSAPLTWEEIASCEPGDFTLATMPARFAEIGDRHRDIDSHAGSISALLELSARHEGEGLGDAPWPPQYKKQEGEPPRVQPSKRRKAVGEVAKDGGVTEQESASERPRKGQTKGPVAKQEGAQESDATGRPPTHGPVRKEELKRQTSASSGTPRGAATKRASKPGGAKEGEATSRAVSKEDAQKGRGRRVPRHPLIEVARARRKDDALADLDRWKERHPDAASHLDPADVLVDAMRGRSATWTRIRVNLQHIPPELRPAQEHIEPSATSLSGWNHE